MPKIVLSIRYPPIEAGQRYGNLVVVGIDTARVIKTTGKYWICRCDCGNEVSRASAKIKAGGNTNSCGCATYFPAGSMFGDLEILSRFGSHKTASGRTTSVYTVMCHACGEKRNVSTKRLRKGHCSCLSAKKKLFGAPRDHRSAYRHTEWGAKKRHIEFALTYDEFAGVRAQSCTYCGQEYIGVGGVDRVDSDVGYVMGNVVSCCSICNLMKNRLSVDEFYSHVERISRYHKEEIKALVEYA